MRETHAECMRLGMSGVNVMCVPNVEQPTSTSRYHLA